MNSIHKTFNTIYRKALNNEPFTIPPMSSEETQEFVDIAYDTMQFAQEYYDFGLLTTLDYNNQISAIKTIINRTGEKNHESN